MEPRERQEGAEEESGFLISLQISAASSKSGSFKCSDCYLIEFLISLAWIEFWFPEKLDMKLWRLSDIL